ncbi:MAG TPA: DUF3842 family protein [Firmicutes bacterium]|nr:DUF3842 family protein [Bacillota bacterium]HHY99310.1 DUF3842 family protein [Bacillota bacterium]
MKIAVVDGQGGGIGRSIIERLRRDLTPEELARVRIIALGTNALATGAMLKAGADEGATGENAVVHTVETVDLILGPLGIVLANSMLGELTPRMAKAITTSRARKLLIPMNRCGVEVVGIQTESMPRQLEILVEKVKAML